MVLKVFALLKIEHVRNVSKWLSMCQKLARASRDSQVHAILQFASTRKNTFTAVSECRHETTFSMGFAQYFRRPDGKPWEAHGSTGLAPRHHVQCP